MPKKKKKKTAAKRKIKVEDLDRELTPEEQALIVGGAARMDPNDPKPMGFQNIRSAGQIW